jgi:site-specific DNA-cytosine methylase
MIYEFLRFLEALKPVYFVMENISGLKSIDGGGLISEIVRRMDDLGYNVSHGLVCAADYGCAQLRRRYFFIGVRKPYPKVPMPPATHGAMWQALQLRPYVGVGEAFAGLPIIMPHRNGANSNPMNGSEHEAVLLDKPNPKAAKRKPKQVSYLQRKPTKKPNGQRKPKKAVGNNVRRQKRAKSLH